MRETIKASEMKHEASRCACDPLKEIADAGYGVSGDCSSAIARRLIKTYNSKADIYEQVVQKKGQPLREGFSVVKVRAARA